MGISWLKKGEMSDKMRQDGAKMRKMKDVSSVLGPPRGYEHQVTANTILSRGAGEVPPLGRVNPSRDPPQNPDSRRSAQKLRFRSRRPRILADPPRVLRCGFNVDVTESR